MSDEVKKLVPKPIKQTRVKRRHTTYVSKIFVLPTEQDIEDILNPPKTRPIQLINDDETLKEIELMAKVHCTEQEMQRILDVSEATWNQFKKDYPIVERTIARGRESGKLSLRHKQFQIALEDGNVQMAIWLGKQYLGQTDKTQTENNVNLQVLKTIMDLEEDTPITITQNSNNNSNGNSNDE